MDISGLLNDPGMQFGLGLLGAHRSQNPIADAAAMMNAMQQAKSQQTLQGLQGQRMQQQTVNEQQAQQIELQKYQMQQKLIQDYQRQQALGAGQPQGSPEGLPVEAPNMGQPVEQPTGKYGTPLSLLNNFVKIESSGNPHAIGPSVPGQGNAMGLFQFMPGTVNMLKKQGIDFNPLVPDQRLQDAADFYFQQLLKKNNGDVTAALNDWQGAKKTVGSPANLKYNARALQGVQLPGAPPTGLPTGGAPSVQIPQVTGQPPQVIDPRAAALQQADQATLFGMVGLPGAAQMMEGAKLRMPTNVPAGSYQQGANGQLTYMPDPNKVAEMALKQKEFGLTNEKTTQELQDKALAQREKQSSAISELRNITSGMQRLSTNVDELLNHPGLPSNTGLTGAAKLYNLTPEGRDASILLEGIKSKLVVDILRDLKASSKNGASGFGALSDPEGKILETYIENLNRAQTLPAMQKALTNLKTFSQNAISKYNEAYKNTYGGTLPELAGATPTEQSTAPTGGAPATGTVKGGYMFKGGNPADKASWIPVPGAK